jgi:hypothetical protein
MTVVPTIASTSVTPTALSCSMTSVWLEMTPPGWC